MQSLAAFAAAVSGPLHRFRTAARRRSRRHSAADVAICVAAVLAVATVGVRDAAAQLRLVNWNIAGLLGDDTAIRDTLATIAIDDLSGFAVAPHVILLQEVRSGNQNTLVALAEQATGLDYALATYTNFSEDGSAGAQALLYRVDSLVEIPAGHRDLFTGAGRWADRWQMRWLAAAEDEGTLWIYSAHLKASPGGDNEQQRLTGAMTLRDDIATLPSGANVIAAGDFNLYSNLEPAFLEFLEPGPNPLFDPLGGGPWGGPGNAIKHTQSPRASAGGGLVGGGLDDRFDFVLPSISLDDGAGLSALAATYRTVGNDGAHYDTSINAGTNTYFPGDIALSNALADDLFAASDHLPVLVDFQVPAVLDTGVPTDLGRIIRGTGLLVPATYENATPVTDPDATDPIFITWSTTGSLVGGGVGLAEPLAGPQSLPAALLTFTEGAVSGTIELATDAEGVLDPVRSLATSATVLRPSDPSFDPGRSVVELEVDATAEVGGRVIELTVPLFNLGFGEFQSRLDVDAVDGLAGGLALDGPLAIGAGSATAIALQFDPAGRPAGVVEVPLVVTTSDEDVPGESMRSLDLLVRVTITGGGDPLDLDGDGMIGFGDLLAVLSAFGPCPDPPMPCPADVDGSGSVDFGDVLTILAAFDG